MKKDPHIGQFFSAEEEPCPSLEEMQAYASGKLPSVERHAFERHLLNCELCSFAYEGLAGEDPVEVEASVAAITEEAWNRVGEREKRKRRGVYMWMSGAAVILLLIVVGYFVIDGTANKDHLQGLADAMLEESGDMTDTPTRGIEGTDKYDNTVEYADGSGPLQDEEGKPEFRNDGFKDLEANATIDGEPMKVVDEVESEVMPVEEEIVVERPDEKAKNDYGPPTGNAGWYGTATTPAKDALPGKKENSGFLAGDANTVTTVTIADAVPETETRSSVTPLAPQIEQQGNIAHNGAIIMADSMSTFNYSSNNASPSINQPLNEQDKLFAMQKEQEKKSDADGTDMGGGEIGFADAEDLDDDFGDDFAAEEAEETIDMVEEDVSSDPADQSELLEKTVVSADEISGRRLENATSTVGGVTSGTTYDEGDYALVTAPVTTRDRRNNDNRKSAKGKAKAPARNQNLEMADSKSEPYRDSRKSSYEQGIEQFQRKEYREAAANLRQAAADTPDNLNAHLLAAKSFLQLKQPNAAIYHLDRILATPNTSLEEDAKWFKSIALLQLGKKTDAEVLLKDVESKGGSRSKAAKKALDKF